MFICAIKTITQMGRDGIILFDYRADTLRYIMEHIQECPQYKDSRNEWIFNPNIKCWSWGNKIHITVLKYTRKVHIDPVIRYSEDTGESGSFGHQLHTIQEWLNTVFKKFDYNSEVTIFDDYSDEYEALMTFNEECDKDWKGVYDISPKEYSSCLLNISGILSNSYQDPIEDLDDSSVARALKGCMWKNGIDCFRHHSHDQQLSNLQAIEEWKKARDAIRVLDNYPLPQ